METIDEIVQRYRWVHWIPAVEVKYLGPTETRGGRMRFRRLDTDTRLILPFQYRYDYSCYAAAVAEQMLGGPVLGISTPDAVLFVPERP